MPTEFRNPYEQFGFIVTHKHCSFCGEPFLPNELKQFTAKSRMNVSNIALYICNDCNSDHRYDDYIVQEILEKDMQPIDLSTK